MTGSDLINSETFLFIFITEASWFIISPDLLHNLADTERNEFGLAEVRRQLLYLWLRLKVNSSVMDIMSKWKARHTSIMTADAAIWFTDFILHSLRRVTLEVWSFLCLFRISLKQSFCLICSLLRLLLRWSFSLTLIESARYIPAPYPMCDITSPSAIVVRAFLLMMPHNCRIVAKP